jgi:hypothetical protein
MRKLFYVALIGLLALLVLPGAVSAATDTGTAAVVANIGGTIDLTVTGSIGSWSLAVGDNTDTTTVDANVKSTDTYDLKVRDALTDAKPAASVGKMAEWNGAAYVTPSGKVLTNALQVNANAGTYATLSGSDATISSGAATVPAGVNYDIGIKQTVAFGDTTLDTNNYRIVVTLTATTT